MSDIDLEAIKMLLKLRDNKDAPFNFLEYAHSRLLNRFYSNGLNPKITHKDIFQYFSQLFRFDKETSKKVMFMLERKGYVSIQKGSGNGNYSIIIKQEAKLHEQL